MTNLKPTRFEAISDLPEWTVFDNEKKCDLFPTKSGNRDFSCVKCNKETALLIAKALNFYILNKKLEGVKIKVNGGQYERTNLRS